MSVCVCPCPRVRAPRVRARVSVPVFSNMPEEYCKFAKPIKNLSLPVRSTCHMHVSVAVPKLYSCFFCSKTLLLYTFVNITYYNQSKQPIFSYVAIRLYSFKVKSRVVLWKYLKYLYDNIYILNKFVRVSRNIFLILIKLPK